MRRELKIIEERDDNPEKLEVILRAEDMLFVLREHAKYLTGNNTPTKILADFDLLLKKMQLTDLVLTP